MASLSVGWGCFGLSATKRLKLIRPDTTSHLRCHCQPPRKVNGVRSSGRVYFSRLQEQMIEPRRTDSDAGREFFRWMTEIETFCSSGDQPDRIDLQQRASSQPRSFLFSARRMADSAKNYTCNILARFWRRATCLPARARPQTDVGGPEASFPAMRRPAARDGPGFVACSSKRRRWPVAAAFCRALLHSVQK